VPNGPQRAEPKVARFAAERTMIILGEWRTLGWRLIGLYCFVYLDMTGTTGSTPTF